MRSIHITLFSFHLNIVFTFSKVKGHKHFVMYKFKLVLTPLKSIHKRSVQIKRTVCKDIEFNKRTTLNKINREGIQQM